MIRKSSRLLTLILIVTAIMLIISGCGKSGKRFENKPPVIKITSYGGTSDTHQPAYSDSVQSFQQKIFWHATDEDGIITGCAFRILDEDFNPIATPGYEFITVGEHAEIIPPALLELGEGWVIHYMPGADEDIPLDDPEARRTVWTTQKYAVINFPAANEHGEQESKISRFEIVAIDNRGAISEVAWREFKAHSEVPECFLSTTKGNPNAEDTGSGLQLAFTMVDHDPFVLEIPFEYLFRIVKAEVDDSLYVTSIIDSTAWYSTYGQDRIDRFLLTGDTEPALTYDYDEVTGEFLNTLTIVEARARDMAGILSAHPDRVDENVHSTLSIRMKVKPGFSPKTHMYSEKIYAMSDHHYDYWRYDSTLEELPFMDRPEARAFATPFFKDANGRNTVVHSPNLRVNMRWGWYGEYAHEDSHGNFTPKLDEPFEKKIDDVLDEDSFDLHGNDVNYYSEIIAFDLRYDDDAFDFAPYRDRIITEYDDEGEPVRWLRIPVGSVLGQALILTADQVSVGSHKFEVRCVDMQNIPSKNPFVWEFDVVEYIPPAQRKGILIIDDDAHNPTSSPEDIVDKFYEGIIEDLDIDGEDINIIKMSELETDLAGDKSRKLAYSDLQKHKLVIYHADNPLSGGDLQNIDDALTLYMQRGGNLLISHTSQLNGMIGDIANFADRRYLLEMFGITRQSIGFTEGMGSFFCWGAKGEKNGFEDMNLQYGTGDDASFSPMVNARQGYNQVAYFRMEDADGNKITDAEPIYSYICKPTDHAMFPPSEAEFDRLNGQAVGIRKINNAVHQNSRAYIFGVPLSYLKMEEVKAMIEKVWSELP